MIAYANARLIEVHGRGSPEDFDDAAVEGAVKWRGDLPAQLVEKTLTTVTDGRLDELLQTTLTVQLVATADIEPEDLVTYLYNGAELTRRVRHVQAFAALGFVRLSLWDA